MMKTVTRKSTRASTRDLLETLIEQSHLHAVAIDRLSHLLSEPAPLHGTELAEARRPMIFASDAERHTLRAAMRQFPFGPAELYEGVKRAFELSLFRGGRHDALERDDLDALHTVYELLEVLRPRVMVHA